MAPGQVPHQPAPWRATHSFFLSPLMGLLSRAWSRLKGPGPPEPWLLEAVTRADGGEPGLEGDAKASQDTHPQEEPGDSAAAEVDGEAPWGSCPDLEAKCSPFETWGLSDDEDDERGGEEATSVPREHGSEFTDDLPAPLSPSLLMRAWQDLPGAKESKEAAVTKDKDAITFTFPLSPRDGCPGTAVEEEEEDGEVVNKEAPRTSSSPLAPGPQPHSWVCCPVEGATEEERTENKAATKPSTSLSSLGSHPRSWECCSGEEPEEEEDKRAEQREAGPEPHSAILAQSPLLRTRQHQSSEISEEEDEEKDEDSDLGAAEGPSSSPPTSAFLKAWVYRPGEDTEEEEDGDSDAGTAKEEGGAGGPSSSPPTSAFLRAWLYRPGEDTEEEEEEEDGDSDAEAAEEEGGAGGPSSSPPTSAFLRAWVYRPGEDTEEEDDDEEEEDDESEAADWGPSPSLQAQRTLLGDQINGPGKKTDGGEAAEEWEEAEPCPFRVAIYLPREKTPPPWAPFRLPLHLQRRLKPTETPTNPARHQDPEPPLKTRKVRFSEKVSVHLLAVWAGPAQAARRGPWEQFARDRSRFARRIARAQEELGPYLTPAARARAWARLRNPPTPLATIPAPTQTLPMSPIPAMPLSHAVASVPTPWVSPGLDLSGRRG
uniref:Protein phosphatase 1 regulatory subunit 15A n=1 Tax=Catagonus wagneri TaxID=51154 RepID=A0A8C3YCW2_9CETA